MVTHISTRYFLLFSKDKEYLKELKKIIIDELRENYKVDINEKKTMILSAKNGIVFLGYRFRLVNQKTIITLSSATKNRIYKNLRLKKKKYKKGEVSLKEYYNCLKCYRNALKYTKEEEIKRYIDEVILG